MPDDLYTEVDIVFLSESDGPLKPFYRARVVFNGKYVAEGIAPDFGVHKTEGNSRSTAIAASHFSFNKMWVKDVRSPNGNLQARVLPTPTGAESGTA